MSLPIRTPILDYERDTYLIRIGPVLSPRPTDVAEATRAAAEHGEAIDCALGYGQWGTSPRAREVFGRLDPSVVSCYPGPSHESPLKEEILARFKARGVTPDELFLGHGSFNLVERLIHKFIKAEIMMGVGPQFTEVPSEFIAAGGTYHPVPLQDDTYSLPVAELESALATHSVSMLYIDNPNNPLGRCFTLAEMERLAHACVRHDTVLVVDEAWGDFVEDNASSVHLVGTCDNLVVVRSFSKALGLAAERVGYMFMSRNLAAYFKSIDVPFEPSMIGAILATETLRDTAFIDHIRSEVRSAKAEIVAALEDVGLRVLPTHDGVSIMAVHVPSQDIVGKFISSGIVVLAGSSFAHTHRKWDDSYCRLRVVPRSLVERLCKRIRAL